MAISVAAIMATVEPDAYRTKKEFSPFCFHGFFLPF
jgi:hypothetical protein